MSIDLTPVDLSPPEREALLALGVPGATSTPPPPDVTARLFALGVIRFEDETASVIELTAEGRALRWSLINMVQVR